MTDVIPPPYTGASRELLPVHGKVPALVVRGADRGPLLRLDDLPRPVPVGVDPGVAAGHSLCRRRFGCVVDVVK